MIALSGQFLFCPVPARRDAVQCALVALPEQGVGADDLQSSLPASATL